MKAGTPFGLPPIKQDISTIPFYKLLAKGPGVAHRKKCEEKNLEKMLKIVLAMTPLGQP